MKRRWDVQAGENWWLSFGFHVDHTDPSITLHLPGIILAFGRLKQPGFRWSLRVGKRTPENEVEVAETERFETKIIRGKGGCGHIFVDGGIEVVCVQRVPCPDHSEL